MKLSKTLGYVSDQNKKYFISLIAIFFFVQTLFAVGIQEKPSNENLLRGKIDLFVTIEDCSNNQSKSINSTVVNDYINQLRDIYSGDEIELLKLAIKLPNIINNILYIKFSDKQND